MRLHISLDDGLVEELDHRVGRRRRSTFIAETLRRALEDERRWEDIEAGLRRARGARHEWDPDPAGLGAGAAPWRPHACRLAVPPPTARADSESMPLLLDTTVLIDALRGRAVAERVRGLRGIDGFHGYAR